MEEYGLEKRVSLENGVTLENGYTVIKSIIHDYLPNRLRIIYIWFKIYFDKETYDESNRQWNENKILPVYENTVAVNQNDYIINDQSDYDTFFSREEVEKEGQSFEVQAYKYLQTLDIYQ